MEPKTVTLLIVDDDEIDREAIMRSLHKERVLNPVVTAGDGVEALELLRRDGDERIERPVIVILDWKMPRMNGLEFLEELRADPNLRETVVFVLTTSQDEEDIMNAYRNLVAGYIVKDSAGRDFINLVQLLDNYWRVVELPA